MYCDKRAVLLMWKAWARSCVAILPSMMGYKLIVERPTVTGTRARGTNGPTESAALAILSVMVDWMMGLIWVVRDGRSLNF